MRYISCLIIIIIFSISIGTLAQTSTSISRIEVSPDGQFLAGSGNESVRIWEIATGMEVLNFDNTYSTYVRDISWSSDSTKLVTVSDDQVVRIWQIVDSGVITGILEVELTPPLAQLGLIESLDWSPDGQFIAVGGSGGQSIQIWNANTYQLDNELLGSPSVSELEWKPDVTQLSLAGAYSYEGQVIYYDSISSELNSICNNCVVGEDGFQTIAWNHTGTKLALGTTDGMIYIIDMSSGNTLLSFATGTFVNDLAWNFDDTVIVSSSLEGTSYNLNLWNTLSGEFIATLNVAGNFPAVDFHPISNDVLYYDSTTDTILSEDISSFIGNPTPTPTTPPTTGDFTVTSRLDGLDDNQQAIFTYTLTNSSSTPQANLYMRLFFTVDNGHSADDYLLEAYYDSSNALVITGPFQWDANNHYFILSYGSSALAPNANYQFQGVLRLLDWGTDFSSANDWWHTGISTQDSPSDYLPVYAGGVLNTGLEPNGTAQPTNTPAPTTTPAPSNTPDGTAVLQVENRTDGVDNNQQVSFRYRLTNISTQAQGNLSTRIYFTLDGSEVASDYVLEQYYDQSGVASVSGPTLASGDTYYFQVDYGATSLQPNNSWEFQGALHLVNYVENFDSSNDWWHTGIGSTYQETTYLPTYINGVIEVGQEP